MSEAVPRREWRFCRIDRDTLWSIVETDIPDLLEQLRELKAGLGSEAD